MMAGIPDARRPSMKDRQRQMREAAILQTAHDLMAAKGFVRMTLDEVIFDVGISKPTFYQHFESKEKLALTVLLTALREARARLDLLAATLPPEDALWNMIGWVVDMHFAAGSYYDLRDTLPLSDDARLRDAERGLVAGLTNLVQSSQQRGRILTPAPAALIAHTLHGLLKACAYEDVFGCDRAAMKAGVAGLFLVMPGADFDAARSDQPS